MQKKALFIFRRDLALQDNTALIEALKNSKEVIACFIFTPEQVEKNPYLGQKCLKFMLECLEDLGEQLKDAGGKLYFFRGKPKEIVEKCILKLGVDAVFVNQDYTPYSIKRDLEIEGVCKKHKCAFYSFHDLLLHSPESVLKADGKPYSIFTPYFRSAARLKVREPQKNNKTNYYKKPIPFETKIFPKVSESLVLKGGRQEGLKVLKKLKKTDQTSHLSAYLKFNVISIREVYYFFIKTLGKSHALVRSLFWRDFFTQLGLFFPYVFGGAFHKKFNKLPWKGSGSDFKKWCEGKTGFPIVDAGMRELNETGCMPNRIRMIVASFLVKDLHINWRKGEKYFAKHLIDYDPAVNNGNWQWCASTGADAAPYFRIFNPWAQQKKFDPECVYIKKWLPELKNASVKEIHEGKATEPMLDHAKEAKLTLSYYRKR